MLDFKDLETFLWVARLNGFRAAAEKLRATQPSISSRVARIEAALGVSLFDRGPRGTALTDKGRELLAYAERLLALRDEVVAVVGSREALRGVVRLGASETIVHTWLSRLVGRLHATYPHITLEIEVDVTPNLRAALLSQELDVAILLGPLAEPRTSNLPLSTYPVSFVARSDADILGATRPLSVADLRKQPVITYPRSTRPFVEVRDALTVPGEPAPRIFANASLSTIVRMALDGIGLAVIPAVLVEREIAAGLLQVVEAQPVLAPLTFTATWLAGTADPTVRAVVDTAREVAREQPFAAVSNSTNLSGMIRTKD